MECRGWRTRLAFEARDCVICHKQQGPCTIHACAMCRGSGLVCPGCNGMRFVRTGRHPGDVKRCDTCTEGNGVNDDREGRAIVNYLATGNNGGRWIKVAPEELTERRMEKIRRDKEAADAHHREWASVHITARQKAMERRDQRLNATVDAIAARGITPLSGPELLRLAPRETPRGKTRTRRDGDRR